MQQPTRGPLLLELENFGTVAGTPKCAVADSEYLDYRWRHTIIGYVENH